MIRIIAITLAVVSFLFPRCSTAEESEEEFLPTETAEPFEVNDEEDLVVDRDRGRDERRNLYEQNRDTVKRDAHERARSLRIRNNQRDMQQQEDDEASQMQQSYYYYYPK